MSFNAEEAYLQKENVSEHLGKIVDRVIAEKPKDAYSLVEVLSRLVKASVQPPSPDAPPEAEADRAEAVAKYFQKARQLDAVPKDEGGEPVQVCSIPNYMEEAEMLSWAGVGFGELESYRVMCSLRNLANKEAEAGLTKLRFWGKILGTGSDYYVAEAQRGQGDLPEGEEEMEVPGTPGVNLYLYYVTNDLCGDWQKLPDVRPAEIVAARKIRRIMTGNADEKVITHPHFDGTEAMFLRAQIARITADTVLCEKGFLFRDEEAEEGAQPEEKEDFVAPPPPVLVNLESWTHMTHHVLKNGRTEYKELPDDIEDEEKAKIEEERSADKPRDMIRGLVGDDLEWTIKQTGDPTVYANPVHSTVVTCVRSLTWPGAVCVARGKTVVNHYVGYGLPARQPEFFPPEPPDVQEEPEDPGEQPQPPGTEEVEEAPAEES
uniref:Radial spokehead-like protein n=1 Tax=Alexandrium catenella TaxID=2925 RepID=A0A7S1SDH7_ALECA|mmetsp:Transcript_94125/g.249926  ORF Transcript_94125/g.249926 Transcript_94125/m.249926 type:complete len:433 (+) Transcript_94125:67-1365(+)